MKKILVKIFYSKYSPFIGVISFILFLGSFGSILLLGEEYPEIQETIFKYLENRYVFLLFTISYYSVITLNIYAFILAIYCIKKDALDKNIALGSLATQLCIYIPLFGAMIASNYWD